MRKMKHGDLFVNPMGQRVRLFDEAVGKRKECVSVCLAFKVLKEMSMDVTVEAGTAGSNVGAVGYGTLLRSGLNLQFPLYRLLLESTVVSKAVVPERYFLSYAG